MRPIPLLPLLLALPLAAQTPRDPTQIAGCSLVSGAELAALAKARLLSPPLGKGGHCRYTLERPNGEVESYGLALQSAALVEPALKAMSASERGQALPGLWDTAYLSQDRLMSQDQRLVLLQRGGLALELNGPRAEVLQAAAKLAIGRLK